MTNDYVEGRILRPPSDGAGNPPDSRQPGSNPRATRARFPIALGRTVRYTIRVFHTDRVGGSAFTRRLLR